MGAPRAPPLHTIGTVGPGAHRCSGAVGAPAFRALTRIIPQRFVGRAKGKMCCLARVAVSVCSPMTQSIVVGSPLPEDPQRPYT